MYEPKESQVTSWPCTSFSCKERAVQAGLVLESQHQAHAKRIDTCQTMFQAPLQGLTGLIFTACLPGRHDFVLIFQMRKTAAQEGWITRSSSHSQEVCNCALDPGGLVLTQGEAAEEVKWEWRTAEAETWGLKIASESSSPNSGHALCSREPDTPLMPVGYQPSWSGHHMPWSWWLVRSGHMTQASWLCPINQISELMLELLPKRHLLSFGVSEWVRHKLRATGVHL